MKALLFVIALATAAYATDVDLEWRLMSNTAIHPGDNVQVGLYAVAREPVIMGTMDVIVFWDAEILALTGVDDQGPYDWMYSGFRDDSRADGLNDTWDDGNGYYKAWGQIGGLPFAVPKGFLITVVELTALTPGECHIEIIPEYGIGSETAVWGGWIPGINVVGELGDIVVTVERDEGIIAEIDADID